MLFVEGHAVGVIEAKRIEEGQNITQHEAQTEGYAAAKLKWVNNQQPLPFLYESTGIITRFTFSGQLVAQDTNDEPASALLARIKAERAAQPA